MISNDSLYDRERRAECRTLIPEVFHIDLPVDEFLFDDVETGRDSYATIFKSNDDIYVLLKSDSSQTLGEVQRMIKNMGMTPQKVYPPEADPTYFYRHSIDILRDTFPALKHWTYEDVMMYSKKVEYTPALVKIASVNGEIRRYNSHGSSWQKIFDFSFKKVGVRYE